jgi:putative oxidoreductase
MNGVCDMMSDRLSTLKDIPLLIMRLILAYGFWSPGIMKWQNIDSISEWFAGMGIPFPTLNAYLSASTEVVGAVLLLLGFAVRVISIPLMIVMIVAITTVHFANGFEAGSNGFEIPLYYFIMLFTLFVYGGGNIGVQGLIRKFSKED